MSTSAASRIAVVAALMLAARTGWAQQPAPPRVVALVPLSVLGTEDTSVSTRKLTRELEAGLAALPNTKVVTSAQVADAIKRAKKPQLKVCDRDPACLGEVGKLVGATIVVDGEVAGLGESKIVYLAATDATTAKELRSTTLSIGAKADSGGGPTGAAVRLLEPDRYRGVLRFVIDAKGATVYVNGSKAVLGAKNEIALPVGTQAVRVTHPEYRDFVRFIDVPYNQTTDVSVGLTAYPTIKHDLQGKPINSDSIEYIDPPFYRRPLFVGSVAVVVTIATAVIVGAIASDSLDNCRKVGGGSCD